MSDKHSSKPGIQQHDSSEPPNSNGLSKGNWEITHTWIFANSFLKQLTPVRMHLSK